MQKLIVALTIHSFLKNVDFVDGSFVVFFVRLLRYDKSFAVLRDRVPFVCRLSAACNKKRNGGAAVAQWIRSRLPSCRPGFDSQAHHLRFFNLNCNMLKRRK